MKKIHKNSQEKIPENNLEMKNIFTPIREVLSRFPIAITLFATITIIWSIQILTEIQFWDSNFLEKITLSIGISAILSIAFRFLYEKFWNKNLHFLQILAVVYGIFVYISYNSSFEFFSTTICQLLAFFGSIFWISHKDSPNDEFFYNNFLKNISALLLWGLLGILSGILGWLAIGGISSLFELNNIWKYAGVWWAISIGFLAPLYTLSQTPKQNEIRENIFEKYIIWEFFTKFLFVPFVIVYFVILYAYSVKVLANFSDWPRGEVSWLVMGFSILGFLVYILTKSIENNFIKKFRKFLPFLVFPQIFMLFYAIYLRIDQYGLTTNRYIVVLAGVALFLISLYYIISQKKSLKYIPMIFSIMAFVFSFGPWGIHNLPQKLQFESLKNILIETKMYENGEFKPFDSEKFSIQTKEIIRSKIEYLCSGRENSCNSDEITEFFKSILENKTESGWQISRALGVSYSYEDEKNDAWQERKYVSFYNVESEYIAVNGFDYYLPRVEVGQYSNGRQTHIPEENLLIISTKNSLKISDNWEIFEYNFEKMLNELKDQNPLLNYVLRDAFETTNYSFKFHFSNIAIEKSEKPILTHAAFDIYIKKK